MSSEFFTLVVDGREIEARPGASFGCATGKMRLRFPVPPLRYWLKPPGGQKYI